MYQRFGLVSVATSATGLSLSLAISAHDSRCVASRRGVGPWYGCCVLALSGHQDNLPAGWIGGNRIAIHGTPGSVGGAESHGCLRASDPDMIALFARVPLGAPVFIRA